MSLQDPFRYSNPTGFFFLFLMPLILLKFLQKRLLQCSRNFMKKCFYHYTISKAKIVVYLTNDINPSSYPPLFSSIKQINGEFPQEEEEVHSIRDGGVGED